MTATFVHTPLAQTVLPRPSRTRDLLLVLGGSLFVAALAQVRIPLPFTPVPITGQTFGVMLVGAGFGARLGFLTLLVYLLEGILGLPFFSGGGSGLSHLAGRRGATYWLFP
jgi:biotin transport system substrate-specific component